MRYLACFALLLVSTSALARDNGQYGDVPEATRNWVKGLKSPASNGVACCDIEDGNRDILWDTAGPNGQYRVFVEKQWVVVPVEAVISEPNRLGYPVVWVARGDKGALVIRCFLVGAGG